MRLEGNVQPGRKVLTAHTWGLSFYSLDGGGPARRAGMQGCRDWRTGVKTAPHLPLWQWDMLDSEKGGVWTVCFQFYYQGRAEAGRGGRECILLPVLHPCSHGAPWILASLRWG